MTKLTKPSSGEFIAALDNYINAKILDNEQIAKGSPQEVARSLKRVQSATESLYKTLEEYLDLVVEYKLTEAIKSDDVLKNRYLK